MGGRHRPDLGWWRLGPALLFLVFLASGRRSWLLGVSIEISLARGWGSQVEPLSWVAMTMCTSLGYYSFVLAPVHNGSCEIREIRPEFGVPVGSWGSRSKSGFRSWAGGRDPNQELESMAKVEILAGSWKPKTRV
uniref:Uncharacterized protein n=1 Tax=Cannabis sativa TaxID=3483 RepID=A0A803Q9G7_CANSA